MAQALFLKWGWKDPNNPDRSLTYYQKQYQTILTVAFVLGAMTAALGGERFVCYGKRTMILATNGLLLVSIGICMIDNSYVILFGRVLYGMTTGAFTVFIPPLVAEMSPTEYRGAFGAVSQFMCVFGALCCALLGLIAPSAPSELATV